MKVFITGISGFVGRHLLDYLLEEGCEVSGISRSGDSPALARCRARWGDRFSVVTLDVTDTSALGSHLRKIRPEGIIHLAGLASPQEANRDSGEGYKQNFLGTISLLEAVRDGVPDARVVLPTSGEVYGVPAALPVDESHSLRPASPYGLSKAAADLAGFQMHWRDGLNVVRVRPFNHTGPGQAAMYVCSEFARALVLMGRSRGPSVLRTGNIDVERDFSDVRDVVRAYVRLLTHGDAGEAYNVASGRTTSVREILEHLRRMAGVDVTIETDPAKLRPNEIPRIEVSIRRITEATGWSPQISIYQTLVDLVNYWREELMP